MSSRPLAERRDARADDGEAEVEVLAEAALVDLALEVAVRRRDDADVHATRLRLADAADLARLERAKELRLELERELADLVEEHGAAVGRLERSGAIAVGAGEGAAHVTEELALDEVRADRAAVDDDERLLRARAALHDLGRDELLARAALALDEDVDVALRDLVEQREHPSHRQARADERAERRQHRNEVFLLRDAGTNADDRIADGEDALGADVAVTQADAVERRAVHRAGVAKRPDAVLANEPAMEARDHRVAQDDVVRGVRADLAHVTVVDDGALGADATFALDLQREARDRDRLDQLANGVERLRGRAHVGEGLRSGLRLSMRARGRRASGRPARVRLAHAPRDTRGERRRRRNRGRKRSVE